MSKKENISETMGGDQYSSYIEKFQHNSKQAEIDYHASRNEALTEQKYIESIITKIKEYCRNDLKNDPEKKKSYLENCINDKYSEQIKLRIYMLIKYQYDDKQRHDASLLLKYKKSSLREKEEIYSENSNKINKIVNIVLKIEGTLFNICRKETELMKIVFRDDPWTTFIKEIMQYYDDIEKNKINRVSGNKPKQKENNQNNERQISGEDLLINLFNVFEEIGFAKNNTSGNVEEYKYEFSGKVTTAHHIWKHYQDYHNMNQQDFFSNYMRFDKNSNACPLKGNAMKSHGISSEPLLILSAEQKEKLDNFFKNKSITT